MGVRYSKSLGSGVRVSFGGSGGRSKGPTQAELKKEEKQDFLDNTKKNFDHILGQYFLSNGYVLFGEDVLNVESDEVVDLAQPLAEGFYKIQRLVRDGGQLTTKRRDQLLEYIYALEEVNTQNEGSSSIAELVDKKNTYQNSWTSLIIFNLFVVLPASFFYPLGWYIFGAIIVIAIPLFNNDCKLVEKIKADAVKIVSRI